MRSKGIILAWFAILVFPLVTHPLAGHAQTSLPADITERFDRAASKHKQELRRLMGRRGREDGLLDMRNASSKSLAKVLATRTEGFSNRSSEAGNWAGYLEKTAILFYSYNQDVLEIWLLNQQGIQAYHSQTIQRSTISSAIATLRNSLGVDTLQVPRLPQKRGIAVVSSANSRKVPTPEAIAALTTILLPNPIAQKLDSVAHLIVVPVLELGTVPYAILKPFKNGTFLMEKTSISIAPSLFDIGYEISRWQPESLPFDALIVGNPYLPNTSNWTLPPLPGAEREAIAVAQLLNVKPLLGREATKQAIVSQASRAEFLYFASHGIASQEDPLSGGFLMLSADRLEQGWWTAKEVQSMRLNAQIAVLSACQTGLGQVHDAGIIGLSRAFQIAGVPRIVMSLWNVDDTATSDLMQMFVHYLQTNIPSEALRLAMLAVKKRHPNPSQWASFVLFGTPR